MTVKQPINRVKPNVADLLRQHLSHEERIEEYHRQRNRPSWQEISLAQINNSLEISTRNKAEAAAKEKAERYAATSTPDLLRAAIRRTPGAMSEPASAAAGLNAAIKGHRDYGAPVPLNGDGVLRAALAGVGGGTINGRNE